MYGLISSIVVSNAYYYVNVEPKFESLFLRKGTGGAHGFYLHKEAGGEFLYVTDTAKGIMVKTTLTGEHLLTIGTPDLPEIYDAERKFVPTDVAVGLNGDIYISDGYGQSWVHQYNALGDYIRSWGGKGSEIGKFDCPHGISVDLRRGEPELYVADRGNHRIQVFTLDGQFKRTFDHDMDMPCSFYFYKDEIYFPDLYSRVTVFDKYDRLVTHLGEDRQAKSQEGWPNLDKAYLSRKQIQFSAWHLCRFAWRCVCGRVDFGWALDQASSKVIDCNHHRVT